MLVLGAQTRRAFFDTLAVRAATTAAQRKVLSRFGAFVQQRAMSSIRSRKSASSPGGPPHSHEGSLKHNIWFAYDEAAQSVVIGPTALNMVAFDQGMRPVSGLVPQILEFGGTAGVVEMATKVVSSYADVLGKRMVQTERLVWVRRDLRRYGKVALMAKLRGNLAHGNVFRVGPNLVVPTGHNRFRTYTIAARPYMGPAFQEELGKLDRLWANSITAGGSPASSAA